LAKLPANEQPIDAPRDRIAGDAYTSQSIRCYASDADAFVMQAREMTMAE